MSQLRIITILVGPRPSWSQLLTVETCTLKAKASRISLIYSYQLPPRAIATETVALQIEPIANSLATATFNKHISTAYNC